MRGPDHATWRGMFPDTPEGEDSPETAGHHHREAPRAPHLTASQVVPWDPGHGPGPKLHPKIQPQ